jgi:thiamine monophosphate kinase
MALAAIPDALTPSEAAPILCAGITTFNSLRHSGAKAGDLVAVQGLGGLSHLGVQFANKMGFHTVAIGRGQEFGIRLLTSCLHPRSTFQVVACSTNKKSLGRIRHVVVRGPCLFFR